MCPIVKKKGPTILFSYAPIVNISFSASMDTYGQTQRASLDRTVSTTFQSHCANNCSACSK